MGGQALCHVPTPGPVSLELERQGTDAPSVALGLLYKPNCGRVHGSQKAGDPRPAPPLLLVDCGRPLVVLGRFSCVSAPALLTDAALATGPTPTPCDLLLTGTVFQTRPHSAALGGRGARPSQWSLSKPHPLYHQPPQQVVLFSVTGPTHWPGPAPTWPLSCLFYSSSVFSASTPE